jgi:uridine kinase
MVSTAQAGKSHFADELTDALAAEKLRAIRASVDGFHNPPDVRYQRGRASPEGFFHDPYDYDALRELLLTPLRTGDGQFVHTVYDVHHHPAPDGE